MTAPIYNPPLPYLGPVFGGVSPGKMIAIQGTTFPTAQRLTINLQCGPNINPRDDIALHVDVRFNNGTIVRNSLVSHNWGPEESHGILPFGRGQAFDILFLAEPHCFKIAINGLHYAEFHHRTPMERVSYLSIEGDATVSCIRIEGGGPQTSYMPTAPGMPYGASSAPYPTSGGAMPYPSGHVMPPGPGVYPQQGHLPVPGYPTTGGYHRSPHHSPHHSPHRSAAIPIVGGAAAGLLTGAAVMGHHKKMKHKKQKKWMKKQFKQKHKHGHHGFHGYHHKRKSSSSSSSSEEE